MAAALAAVIIGLAGLGLSATRVVAALAPRTFTPAQQQQIMAWEVASRWRELPAGAIFPATTTYPASGVLGGGSLKLTAKRLGLAHQATCEEAADQAAASILGRYGCQAVLRATYVDGTGTYLVTIGVVPFSSPAHATATQEALSDPSVTHLGQENALAPGVRAAAFRGTVAASFTDAKRQVSGSNNYGPYVVLYTIGYADSRPKVPVDVDGYTYGEMIAMARGLTGAIGNKLSARPPVPRCPGATGC